MAIRMLDETGTGEPKEIATTLLKLGATSYGGPAIMGVMQAELQQRRKWVSKERFLEGLAVANMVPCPSWLWSSIRPPFASTAQRAMARPSPTPPVSRDRASSMR